MTKKRSHKSKIRLRPYEKLVPRIDINEIFETVWTNVKNSMGISEFDSLAAKTDEVRKLITILAADAVDGGAIDWVAFVGMDQFDASATASRYAAISYQSMFTKALFDLVMTQPDEPMWLRDDSPFNPR
jgi:hypothetical protein